MDSMRSTRKRSRFSRFSLRLTQLITSSCFAGFCHLYRRADEAMRHGFFGRVCARLTLSPQAKLSFKSSLSRTIDNSFFCSAARRFLHLLLAFDLRSVGTYLFTFGFFNCMLYFVRRFLPEMGAFSPVNLIVGAILTLCSLPFLSVHRPLGDAIRKSRSIGAFLTHVAGYRQSEIPRLPARRGDPFFIFFGLISGALCLLISPFEVFGLLALSIIAAMILYKPEFGCVVLALYFPFSDSLALAILTAFILVSYGIKVLRGKRTFRFEFCDFFVALFLLFYLFSGLFAPAAAFGSALRAFFIFLSYFLFKNLLLTRAWFLRVCMSFSVSVALSAVAYALKCLATATADRLPFPVDLSAIPDAQSALLLAASALTFVILLTAKSAKGRFWCFLLLLSFAAAFYCLHSVTAFFALFTALLFLLVFSSRRFFFALVFALCAAAIALPLLPSADLSTLISHLKAASPALVFAGCDPAVLWLGLGVGSQEATGIAAFGVKLTGNLFSAYSQLILSVGLFGTLCLGATTILNFQKATDGYLFSARRNERLLSFAPLGALAGLSCYGLIQNFFALPQGLCLVFFLLALSCAASNLLAAENAVLS